MRIGKGTALTLKGTNWIVAGTNDRGAYLVLASDTRRDWYWHGFTGAHFTKRDLRGFLNSGDLSNTIGPANRPHESWATKLATRSN